MKFNVPISATLLLGKCILLSQSVQSVTTVASPLMGGQLETLSKSQEVSFPRAASLKKGKNRVSMSRSRSNGDENNVLLVSFSVAESDALNVTTTNYSEETNAVEEPKKQGGNPIVGVASFIWSSLVGFKDNTMQLYSNHQTCNAIRAKQKAFAINTGESQRFVKRGYTPSDYQPPKKGDQPINGGVYERTGISYAEYNFLQRGKIDRGKVGQLLFLMVFSPNFLPYAFWFFPNILPTPFMNAAKIGETGILTPWATAVQSRVHAVLKTICTIEQQAMNAPVVSGGFSLNPFGGGKKDAAHQHQHIMCLLYQQAKNIYLPLLLESSQARHLSGESPSSGIKKWKNMLMHQTVSTEDNDNEVLELVHRNGDNQDLIEMSNAVEEPGPTTVLAKLEAPLKIYSNTTLTKGEQRLVGFPKPLLDGLSSAIFDTSPTPGTQASKSGAVATIISNLTPNFVTRNKLVAHLTTLEQQDEFLCFEQGEVRLTLEELYQVCHDRCIGTSTSTEAELRQKLQNWLHCTVQHPRYSNQLFYNGNMARMVLMCANAAEATMEERSCSALPALLYQSQ